jgi:phosphoglycolate phosphatase-like HAD superfamily hydrolase
MISRRGSLGVAAAAFALPASLATAQVSALPSWREGPSRRAILDFVQAVTTEGSADFVPPAERVAVFDNDGTLWVEQPIYTQFLFVLGRIRELAPQHPDWATREPFRSALAGDMAALAASGTRGLVELVMATHTGMTPEAFHRTVADWLATARHPRFSRPFTELAYQPMLELLSFLRAAGFKTWIVSGGGAEFIRVWSELVYGIPREQVIGSTGKTEFRLGEDGTPMLLRLPEVDFIDDGPGKPVSIGKFIGRRPIAAFGNSDGDLQMLQYATARPGRRLGMIIHHDDADREYAYDRASRIGTLDRALDEAQRRGWSVVSMRAEWARIFPWSGG